MRSIATLVFAPLALPFAVGCASPLEPSQGGNGGGNATAGGQNSAGGKDGAGGGSGGSTSDGGSISDGGSTSNGGEGGGPPCPNDDPLIGDVCAYVASAACEGVRSGCVAELSAERCKSPDCVEQFDALNSCLVDLIAVDAWTVCPDYPAACAAQNMALAECSQP
jgi:hypothetical protein